ncbi:ABC transporter permease [Nesterenkonia aerolata]|uniref:Iron ABC transporter permease n=1 Tax=Nesterenkonia aerolata TaxID=3074079 RepID=A0ABU2DQ15_9MICC|nr:iron ABC transporter permease [Nesterenkonia sp. LY-0111]MDR8018598.1 iron ABC transporter permease [Nesterenkonia sp. LY-0111]
MTRLTTPQRRLTEAPSLGVLNLVLWLFCLVVIVAPLTLVVLYGMLSGRLGELATGDVAQATWNSITSAVLSGALAVLMALVFVLLIEHTDLPGRGALRLLALSPMLVPPFIGAISWTGLFGPAGLINRALEERLGGPLWEIYGADGVIFLLALHSYPVAYLVIAAALARIPAELEQAARASGARTGRMLRDVTLPLLRPAMLSSFVLVAVSNLADFGIPSLIGTPAGYETLATVAYRFVRSGTVENPVELAACIGLVLLLLVAVGMFGVNRLSRRGIQVRATSSIPEPIALRRRGLWSALTAAAVSALTVLPLLALCLQALLPAPGVALTWQNITLQNFTTVLESSWTITGAQTSTMLAVGAALISGILGTAIGTVLTRTRLPGRQGLRAVSMAPLAVPGIIVAVGWLLAAPYIGLYNSLWLILCAYVMSFVALVVQTVEAPLRTTSAALEEAARISGAGPLRAFRDVSVRLALPAAGAGALLVLLTAVRELTISALLLPPGAQTLGVAIFNLQQQGAYGNAAALSVLVTVLGLAALGLIGRRLRAG